MDNHSVYYTQTGSIEESVTWEFKDSIPGIVGLVPFSLAYQSGDSVAAVPRTDMACSIKLAKPFIVIPIVYSHFF